MKAMQLVDALERATAIFGRYAHVTTTALRMKATGEAAVGVGYVDEFGCALIQGKGVTWEDAFALLEARREKWFPNFCALLAYKGQLDQLGIEDDYSAEDSMPAETAELVAEAKEAAEEEDARRERIERMAEAYAWNCTPGNGQLTAHDIHDPLARDIASPWECHKPKLAPCETRWATQHYDTVEEAKTGFLARATHPEIPQEFDVADRSYGGDGNGNRHRRPMHGYYYEEFATNFWPKVI